MTAHKYRRSVRILGAVLISFLLLITLLAAAEVVLRLREKQVSEALNVPEDWGEGYLKVTPSNRQGMLEEYEDASGGLMVRTSRAMVRQRFMHDLSFPAKPDPDMVRVFCFGGSATLGVPFERTPGLSFPDRLEVHLGRAGVKAEVYNLGGASFGSDQVLVLIQEAIRYGPSALVVYSGNNEFFNYNLELVNQNKGWTGGGVGRLRILQWLRSVLTEDGGEPDQLEEMLLDQERLVAEVMVHALEELGSRARPVWRDGDTVHRVDRHYQAVVSRYIKNLGDIRSIVEGARTPHPLLLIAEVPVNLLDEPQLALYDPNQGDSQTGRWKELMARGDELSEEGRHGPAAQVYLDAVRLDTVHALGHYRLGMARLAAGDRRGAVLALSNALEMDMDPGRPVAALNQAVRELARDSRVIRVCPEQVFGIFTDPAAARPLFHDSCHLKQDGYDQLAREFSRVLLEELPKQTPQVCHETEAVDIRRRSPDTSKAPSVSAASQMAPLPDPHLQSEISAGQAWTQLDPESRRKQPAPPVISLEELNSLIEPSRDIWQQPLLVLDDAQVQPGDVIADIGVGSGYWMYMLSDAVGPDGRVLAVDFDPNAINFINERLSKNPRDNIEVVLSMAHNITLSPNTVDHVLMVDVHFLKTTAEMSSEDSSSQVVTDFPLFYRSIHQALRPGGQLIFLEARKEAGNGRNVDAEQIIQQLSAVGFEIKRQFDWNVKQYFLIFTPTSP